MYHMKAIKYATEVREAESAYSVATYDRAEDHIPYHLKAVRLYEKQREPSHVRFLSKLERTGI